MIVVPAEGRSLAENINIGLKKAKGDYLIVSNDDITLKSGHLHYLCVPDEVHSPVVHGGIRKTFHAHMFCLPRKVYNKIGKFDESCPGPYYIDSDYWVRLVKAEVPVLIDERVHIDHPEPARTLSKLNNNTEKTREWFINKHGKGYLGLVE